MNITQSIADSLGFNSKRKLLENTTIQIYANSNINRYQWRDSNFAENANQFENKDFLSRIKLIEFIDEYLKIYPDTRHVLKLTLNKKWFDLILSGEKNEEYRVIKKHWAVRFVNKPFAWNSLTKEDIQHHLAACPNGFWKQYDAVEFINGYSKNSPRMILEFKGFETKTGRTEWGAVENEVYFTLKLGDIIETKNIKKKCKNSKK